MIIALLNQKGGVGKTTLSIHIASYLSSLNKKVLLIDADEQASALDWSASRQLDMNFNIIGLAKPIIHREVKSLSANYDFIIIDGPPRIYDVARSAIVASDLVLIPVQPSPYDVWAAKEVVDLVKEVTSPISELKKIDCSFVINRKITNTAIGRDVLEALKPYGLPILDNHICQRIAYAESAATGSTVIELENSSLASKEIKSLVEEILQKYEK